VKRLNGPSFRGFWGIPIKDLMEYDEKSKQSRLKTLQEMTTEDDAAGLTFRE